MNNEMFSDRLKAVMKEQSVSQSDLSRMTGMGRSRISQYVSGQYHPRPEAMKQIADALKVPSGWLSGEIQETEKPLSVPYAASVLNIRPQMLREGLKARKFPFGYAISKNGLFKYYINPTQFEKYRKEILT